ncbi:hypothetical protein [Radicibacter daui]|uniref:hypothetical protein n=1 Tax=Radicibacter daui TaxID=3064829 RepID=UPI004046B122
MPKDTPRTAAFPLIRKAIPALLCGGSALLSGCGSKSFAEFMSTPISDLSLPKVDIKPAPSEATTSELKKLPAFSEKADSGALNRWKSSPSTIAADWPTAKDGVPNILLNGTMVPALSDDAAEGAHIPVPAEIADNFVGRKVTITVLAKRTPFAGTDRFSVGYTSADGVSSGWYLFEPSNIWRPYSFTFYLPAVAETGPGTIGILADADARGRALLVSAVDASAAEAVDQKAPLPDVLAGDATAAPAMTSTTVQKPAVATMNGMAAEGPIGVPGAAPAKRPAKAAPAPAAKPAPKPAAAAKPAEPPPPSSWAALLASYFDRSSAEDGWLQLQKRFPELNNYQPIYADYTQVDGTRFVRLEVAPFSDEDAVHTFCIEAVPDPAFCTPIPQP